jgi:Periplasmic copper-binding protein (NosD)
MKYATKYRASLLILGFLGLSAESSTDDQALAEELSSATGQVLRVANNGLDSSTCGAEVRPCRSIGRAIANANAGDTLLVGPGRYGDLNNNGVFGEPGEEVIDSIQFAVINISKPLRILSRDGASVTVIDSAGAPPMVVSITSGSVIFGAPGRGFTIRGSTGNNGLGVSTSGEVTVAGNIARDNEFDGFFSSSDTRGIRYIGNLAIDNRLNGFLLFGTGHVLQQNVASGNPTGFALGGNGYLLRDNIASGNQAQGFALALSDHRLIRNAAIGNGQSGVRVAGSSRGNLTLRNLNLYGNGISFGSETNCGLTNISGSRVTASDVFFGAASGPGADPADQLCTNVNSDIRVQSIARKEFELLADRRDVN